jgi:hypothetical protein
MSIEIFICKGEQSANLSVVEVCEYLSKSLNYPCKHEQVSNVPWIILDNMEIDMSLTVDDKGNLNSVMIQVGLNTDSIMVDHLCNAFVELGWDVYDS